MPFHARKLDPIISTSLNKAAMCLVSIDSVLAYFVMRIWIYLVFAETRLEISQRTLTPADVEWFKQTLAGDFRLVLNNITYVYLLLGAFLPARSNGNNEERRVLPTAQGRGR